MKTVICWFSGTGNSLAVAKELAKRCGDAELIPMFQALPALSRVEGEKPTTPAERIGLIFPVYGWGPPALVSRFIEKLDASPDACIFSVITYAGSPGGTLSVLRRMLQRRGLDLAVGWGVKMPENYPPLGGAPAPEKQRAINAAAQQKIEQIAQELQQLPRGRIESSAAVWRALSRIVYPLFTKHVRRADRSFRTDEKCNGCGVCAQICPVGDIELADGKPKWLGHCEQCFACFHWCPQQAVQFGRSSKQVRYHHPSAALADFTASKTIQ